MHFSHYQRVESPHSISSASSYETAPTSLTEQTKSRVPKTAIHFDDEAAVGDFNASTLVFPAAYDCRSGTNGTWRNEGVAAIKSPKRSVSSFGAGVKRNATSLSWKSIKITVGEWVESATDEINAHMNHAFDGYDVPELGNRVADFLPHFTIPSRHRIHTAIDGLLDVVQGLLEREPPKTRFEDANAQGCQWIFARDMGCKARRALVEQGICTEWQIIPSQLNLRWQAQLNQALTQISIKHRVGYDIDTLLNMQPKWIGDRQRRTWRLFLDTGIDDWDLDEPIFLDTEFELSEVFARISVRDHCRNSQSVEDEWERID